MPLEPSGSDIAPVLAFDLGGTHLHAAIVNVVDPDQAFTGGDNASAWGERLQVLARQADEARAIRLTERPVGLLPAARGDDVGLIGTLPLVAMALPASAAIGHPADIDMLATFSVGPR